MDQLSSGIFTSSSYDDDFSATLTNLAHVVDVNPVPTRRVNTIHPQSQILGDLSSPVLTRSRAQKSKFGERTKWILKNKRDARGIVVRNKARLVAQGHRQEEGIDYDEGEFEMSAMGRDTSSRFTVKQLPLVNFYSAQTDVKDMLTKFDMESVRTATTPYEAAKTKLKDEIDPPVNVHFLVAVPDINLLPLDFSSECSQEIFKYLKGNQIRLVVTLKILLSLEAYSDMQECRLFVSTSSTEAEYVPGCEAAAVPQVVNTAAMLYINPADSWNIRGFRVHAGSILLLVEFISLIGFVYAVNTSFYAAELVCAGSIMFLLAELFLLIETCLCCLNLVSAVLSLILLVGWFLPLVTQFLLVVSIPAGVSMSLLNE
ncbi:ribonuclease H-like domain, reverse transcriptase, RNA-dependent DNA polymerase [Tanacetum coccineum]